MHLADRCVYFDTRSGCMHMNYRISTSELRLVLHIILAMNQAASRKDRRDYLACADTDTAEIRRIPEKMQ